MVGFAICSYLKTQGPLVASLGLSLLLRSLTTERRRRYLKSCPQVGKSWVFPVKRRFSRVLRVFWKQDKTPENKGEINEIHRKHGGVTQQKQAGSSGKPELTQGWENRNPPFHIQARNTQAPAGRHSKGPGTHRRLPMALMKVLIPQCLPLAGSRLLPSGRRLSGRRKIPVVDRQNLI